MPNNIVCIHGLSWKPSKETLAARFQHHLSEGLGSPLESDSLALAYWADLVGKETDDPAKDQYTEPNGRFEPLSGRELLVARLVGGAKSIGLGALGKWLGRYVERPESDEEAAVSFLAGESLDAITRPLYASLLEDVHLYLRGGQRDAVKARLEEQLQAVPQGRKTCLIAHSMGSMIAADVLASRDLHVDLLLTMGSPLGISVLRRQLGLETAQGRQHLSRNIGRWVNLYDRLDKIALDHDLDDDFPDLEIQDIAIENDFVAKDGERNHHKSYGYLRTAELGELLRDFLSS